MSVSVLKFFFLFPFLLVPPFWVLLLLLLLLLSMDHPFYLILDNLFTCPPAFRLAENVCRAWMSYIYICTYEIANMVGRSWVGVEKVDIGIYSDFPTLDFFFSLHCWVVLVG